MEKKPLLGEEVITRVFFIGEGESGKVGKWESRESGKVEK